MLIADPLMSLQKYESDKAHLLLDGASIAAASTNPHPRCADQGPNEDTCKQTWDFNLVIPDTYFGTHYSLSVVATPSEGIKWGMAPPYRVLRTLRQCLNDTIDPSLLSNCSNILEPAPLSSYFQTEADTDSTVPATTSVPFYAVRHAHCPECPMPFVTKSPLLLPTGALAWWGNFITNHYQYRSLKKLYLWSISQYIFVDAVVSSQKRVSVELAYTSLYPVIEGDNRVTRDMVLNIGFKTTLEKAYSNSNMMKYESDKAHLLLDGVSIAAASTNPHPRCADQGPNEDTCKQTWDFNLVIPDTYFGGATAHYAIIRITITNTISIT
eukprot:sb/3466756/